MKYVNMFGMLASIVGIGVSIHILTMDGFLGIVHLCANSAFLFANYKLYKLNSN